MNGRIITVGYLVIPIQVRTHDDLIWFNVLQQCVLFDKWLEFLTKPTKAVLEQQQ